MRLRIRRYLKLLRRRAQHENGLQRRARVRVQAKTDLYSGASIVKIRWSLLLNALMQIAIALPWLASCWFFWTLDNLDVPAWALVAAPLISVASAAVALSRLLVAVRGFVETAKARHDWVGLERIISHLPQAPQKVQ